MSRITSTPQPQGWADRSASFALGTSATPTALDRSNLRPLTQVFKGAQADYEVTPEIYNHKHIYFIITSLKLQVAQQRATPQQNTSLVAKAMDFVFGW